MNKLKLVFSNFFLGLSDAFDITDSVIFCFGIKEVRKILWNIFIYNIFINNFLYNFLYYMEINIFFINTFFIISNVLFMEYEFNLIDYFVMRKLKIRINRKPLIMKKFIFIYFAKVFYKSLEPIIPLTGFLTVYSISFFLHTFVNNEYNKRAYSIGNGLIAALLFYFNSNVIFMIYNFYIIFYLIQPLLEKTKHRKNNYNKMNINFLFQILNKFVKML